MLITEKINDSAFLQIGLRNWLHVANTGNQSQQMLSFGSIPPSSAPLPRFPHFCISLSLQAALPPLLQVGLQKSWMTYLLLYPMTSSQSSYWRPNRVTGYIVLNTASLAEHTLAGSAPISVVPWLVTPLFPTLDGWVVSWLSLWPPFSLHSLLR